MGHNPSSFYGPNYQTNYETPRTYLGREVRGPVPVNPEVIYSDLAPQFNGVFPSVPAVPDIPVPVLVDSSIPHLPQPTLPEVPLNELEEEVRSGPVFAPKLVRSP